MLVSQGTCTKEVPSIDISENLTKTDDVSLSSMTSEERQQYLANKAQGLLDSLKMRGGQNSPRTASTLAVSTILKKQISSDVQHELIDSAKLSQDKSTQQKQISFMLTEAKDEESMEDCTESVPRMSESPSSSEECCHDICEYAEFDLV